MKLFYAKKHGGQFFCTLFCSMAFFTMARGASAFQLPGTLSGVRHDVDEGYDFLKWSLGPNKTDPAQDVSEASIFLTAAIENAQTDFQEGIINEDYPKLTLATLKQAVIQDADAEGKGYAITKSHRDVPPQLCNWPAPGYAGPLPADIRKTPLGKQGLSNNTGECYIDTALQMLRIELLPLAAIGTDGNTISFPGYPELNKNITCLPYLQKFLLNQISTDEEARSLRMEMAQFVDWSMIAGRPWNPAENVEEGETGCSFGVGGNGAYVLRALLYTLYAPSAMEVDQVPKNISPQTKQEYQYSAHLRQLFVPAVAAGEQVTMSQIIQEDLNGRGRELIGALPPVISYALIPTSSAAVPFPTADSQPYDLKQQVFNRFPSISENMLNSVELRLPAKSNSSFSEIVILKPIAISVRMYVPTVGHLFSFICERGNWYEINNDQVLPIPQEWEKDMSLYIARYTNRIIISYATAEAAGGGLPSPPAFENSVVAAAPSLAEAIALHEQMKAIYKTNPTLVEGLVNYKFYWWAFYKNHPDLRANLDLLMNPSTTK